MVVHRVTCNLLTFQALLPIYVYCIHIRYIYLWTIAMKKFKYIFCVSSFDLKQCPICHLVKRYFFILNKFLINLVTVKHTVLLFPVESVGPNYYYYYYLLSY